MAPRHIETLIGTHDYFCWYGLYFAARYSKALAMDCSECQLCHTCHLSTIECGKASGLTIRGVCPL